MASAAGPATPQRPLPGAYFATPGPQQPTIFAANAASLRQNPQPAPAEAASSTTNTQPQPTDIERAAKTINNTLAVEAEFPPADKTIAQGISGEYELPKNSAWEPFQKLKQHDLPPRILEQANMAGLNMKAGVFGPLSHAWAILDNALYLWDYTLANPELVGWEESRDPIVLVKLVKPKPGVFVRQIEHLIVVVTTQQMLLLGVVMKPTEGKSQSVELYNTQMSIAVRGIGVEHIEASATGRIFFVGNQTDDIYEFQYHREEGWFSGRTHRACHTKSNMSFMQDQMNAVSQLWAGSQGKVLINQLAIDDTRNLLYTLSNTNEIKVWLVRNEVSMVLARPLSSMLTNTGAFCPRSELLTSRNVRLVSISPVPATEARLLGLMATTNTGCRLYMSVMRGYDMANSQMAPNSMQISHVRFPPKDPNAPTALPETASTQQSSSTYNNIPANVDIASQYLTPTSLSHRFPPGYFLSFLPNENGSGRLFCSAPDAARLKAIPDTTPVNMKFVESGTMIDLAGAVCEIACLTGDTGATSTPYGYGNELAVQFDKPSAELAIVTNSYIQTVRRRRLVDIFASMLRQGSKDEEGREGDVVRLIRMYGRTEVAATALAVACGEGMDVLSESSLSKVTDTETREAARGVFINHGGRPEYNANALPENVGSPTDYVRPSPRHEGTALYLSRLIRSMWTVNIIKKEITPEGGEQIVSGVSKDKMKMIQAQLDELSKFLDRVKSSIKELSEGAVLGGIRSRKDEVEIRGEQAAFRGLVQLISSIVEGISFCLVLIDDNVAQILASLSDDSRSKALAMTYQDLFVSTNGKDLAKELVKAIVNRSIANGSNVETVADRLRRTCGSFCSADDVVIFKAQDAVKRASEAGSTGESGRNLLNQSQKLFKKVAASLSADHLHWAASQYADMRYWAGAIDLCLTVAAQKDTARQALAWQRDGKPEGDDRQKAFDARKKCYDLIFSTIEALDKATAATPEKVDGQPTLEAKRRSEAYDVVNRSDDAVFQTCLYEWYVEIGQADRLLEINSRYVTDYLRRKAGDDRTHADLLWKYYAHRNDYLEAASVQLDLARGYFDLSLEERIEYLSRARTNANTRQAALLDSRQSKQQLLREVSDLLDVANIQDDLLQRFKSEPRLYGTRKQEVIDSLSGSILGLDELYNQFADQAGYHDICVLIYAVADHRNPVDIKTTWQNLVDATGAESQALYERSAQSWETLGQKIRDLGRRLEGSDAFFPVHEIVPMLDRYIAGPKQSGEHKPSPEWVLDIFLDVDVPHETLLPILEQLYYSHAEPFHKPSRRRLVAGQIIDLLFRWYRDSERRGERVVFGNEESASTVQDVVASLLREDLDPEARQVGEGLVGAVERSLL